MGDRSGMSISADSPSDETLTRYPLVLLLRRQYEFPFWINKVQFSFLFFITILKLTFTKMTYNRFVFCMENLQPIPGNRLI